MSVQSFMSFRACLGPQKSDSFGKRRRNIAASSDDGPKPGGTATLVATGQLCTAGNGHLKQLNIKGLCQIQTTFTAAADAPMITNHNSHIHKIV